MKKMKDYHHLNLKCDVLWLADAFEKFKKKCLQNYGLCSNLFFSALALS